MRLIDLHPVQAPLGREKERPLEDKALETFAYDLRRKGEEPLNASRGAELCAYMDGRHTHEVHPK
jgi:hypothetical protein